MTYLARGNTHTFQVHMTRSGNGWDVYIKRHWPVGVDFAEHMTEHFRDQNRAEIYALALAETHGDCAVVYH